MGQGIGRLAPAVTGAVALGAVLLGGCSPEDERWYSQAQVEQGARVFGEHCASCHGANAGATPDNLEVGKNRYQQMLQRLN